MELVRAPQSKGAGSVVSFTQVRTIFFRKVGAEAPPRLFSRYEPRSSAVIRWIPSLMEIVGE